MVASKEVSKLVFRTTNTDDGTKDSHQNSHGYEKEFPVKFEWLVRNRCSNFIRKATGFCQHFFFGLSSRRRVVGSQNEDPEAKTLAVQGLTLYHPISGKTATYWYSGYYATGFNIDCPERNETAYAYGHRRLSM
jgi:hypothetical protein